MKINVNGRIKDIGSTTNLDYQDIIGLAYAGEMPPKTLHTVTYQDGVNNAEGTLTLSSNSIAVCEGMIFNCQITDNS